MRVLVTGGAGFIGSHIVEHFQGQDGVHVRVLDNFRTGHRHNLTGFDLDLFEGSVEDQQLVADAMRGVDYVFHLAAMVSVPESMLHPEECVRINTLGTLNILQQAAAHGVKKVVFSSTSAIYGDDPTLPKREDLSPCPLSPYAVTKLDAEYYLDIFAKDSALQTACMRYFNVFGPRQDPNSAYAAAIPIFVSKALKNEDIVIHGDGEQTRDFVSVKDVVRANVLLMSKGSGVYNVGNGDRITINALAEKIVAMTGSASRIVHGPERPGDVRHSVADVARLRSLGFEHRASWDEDLEETVAYFKARCGEASLV